VNNKTDGLVHLSNGQFTLCSYLHLKHVLEATYTTNVWRDRGEF
jgi:hypothetical protein